MSEVKLITTEDRSKTLYSNIYNEHYHSTFGALNESNHIFIEAGLKQLSKDAINIFEMGFGTGLNALLTCVYAQSKGIRLHYSTVEKHILNLQELSDFNPMENYKTLFKHLHTAAWGQSIALNEYCKIHKYHSDILDFDHPQDISYDLVYYDAFSPDNQPELWTPKVFKSIYEHMTKGAILMTYTVKGDVKRALKSVGFKIEKLPGPKGKREILRAWKSE